MDKIGVPHFTLPNTTILTGIVVVLVVANIGVGSALMLSLSQRPQPVIMAPPPTPTPDPTRDWQAYTSEVYGFNAKIPAGWRIQEGVEGGDSMIYFHADEVFGTIRYYVYVTLLENPERLLLRDLVEEQSPGLATTLKEERRGKNTIFITAQAPSRQGALTVYLQGLGADVLVFSLTPYNDQGPFREQERYEEIFNNLLKTVTLFDASPRTSGASGSAEIDVPSFWRTYNDREYPYSFEYPPNATLDTSRQGRVLLNSQIEFVVTSVDPTKCTGSCPVREKESSVKIDGVSAIKYEGYLTSAGGATPQRYLQYVVQRSKQYYMITLYELKVDDRQAANRTPRPIPLEDVQLFEQIISTLRFPQ